MHPKQVTICGQKIRIKTKDIEGDHGRYCHDDRIIYLSDDPEAAKEQWPTLLHEMTHAVLTICGISEVLGTGQEEAICRALENLAPVLALRPKK